MRFSVFIMYSPPAAKTKCAERIFNKKKKQNDNKRQKCKKREEKKKIPLQTLDKDRLAVL